jgi:hypothetical protein
MLSLLLRINHYSTIRRRPKRVAGQRHTALQLQKQEIPSTTYFIYCDPSVCEPRLYVPAPLWLQTFQSFHCLSHTVTKETVKLVSQLFVWPSIQKNCRTWTWTSQPCQISEVFPTQLLQWADTHTDLLQFTASHAGQKPSLFLT